MPARKNDENQIFIFTQEAITSRNVTIQATTTAYGTRTRK